MVTGINKIVKSIILIKDSWAGVIIYILIKYKVAIIAREMDIYFLNLAKEYPNALLTVKSIWQKGMLAISLIFNEILAMVVIKAVLNAI